MTDGTGTEGLEPEDQSGAFAALRKQLREAQKQLKENDPAVVEERVRAQVKRELTASQLMEKAGYPKLADVFLKQVPEGEVNSEAVDGFLQDLGLTTQEPAVQQPEPSEGSSEEQGETGGSVDPAAVAQIAATGGDLAARTAQAGEVDPLAAINAAESHDDLVRLAREGGFLQE